MTEFQEEKRRDLRVTFRATARLRFPGARVFEKCETSDISVSGVFVQGVGGVAPGERCEVEFRLVGRTSSLLLELAGEVVRVAESGVALQFIEVDQDSFCHLQNIVYFNYQEDGGLGSAIAEAPGEIEDEILYLGLDEPRRTRPLPANYLAAEDHEGEDDELDTDVFPHAGYGPDHDD